MQSDTEEELVEDLVSATEARDIRSVEKLIQAGIDPSTPTKSNGCSAIHSAAVLESPTGPEIVARMLHHGADPNAKTPTGLSPLHIAAMWGRYETINVLIDNGANIAVKDDDDMSALDYAEDAEKHKKECIDALTRYRCNKRRNDGFKSKTRMNLNKILGGHVEFSTFLTEKGNTSEDDSKHKSFDNNSSILSDITNLVQEDFDPSDSGEEELLANETLFQTCNESMMHNIASSTMIEGTDGCFPIDKSENLTSSLGYLGDRSSRSSHKSSTSSSTSSSSSTSFGGVGSADETFWSCHGGNTFLRSDREDKDATLPPIRRKRNKSHYFVPLSSSAPSLNGEESNQGEEEHSIVEDEKQATLEETPVPVDRETPEREIFPEEREMIENMSNLLNSSEAGNETFTENNINLAQEATVNYSGENSWDISKLIDYYEDQTKSDEFNPNQSILAESPSKTLKSSHFVIINCRESVPNHQRRSIDELSSITVSYDWKDVSQMTATQELDENIVEVSPSVLALTNMELKDQLISLGEKPGPISDTTRRVYQKHLVRIQQASTTGSHGDQKSKKEEKQLKDYTNEMRQIFLNTLTLPKDKGDSLEQEMSFVFENPEKHTWREGTQKTSFNYILLDPRVTKNLADRGETMSFTEQFRTFVSAIFYIGKGKKSRPYEHFHEAAKYLRPDNKQSKPSNKSNMVLDIWEQGYGVTTLHLFHSVIPVEAYTREACMIDAMSLSRLTNAKHGDFYGPASSWSTKKKRLLGIHLLMKALKIYLIEGERQIKQRDLTK
ncbi:ankyrin repeat and LEM domain-containing protein 1-like isoform X2 [Clytia hemisphaerica]|uniref:LEM domain-containing protein n=2 Tax=Clytia hemisphaerica TaxID=252671 RepID=A0A7M5WQQ3_9CNID